MVTGSQGKCLEPMESPSQLQERSALALTPDDFDSECTGQPYQWLRHGNKSMLAGQEPLSSPPPSEHPHPQPALQQPSPLLVPLGTTLAWERLFVTCTGTSRSAGPSETNGWMFSVSSHLHHTECLTSLVIVPFCVPSPLILFPNCDREIFLRR